MILDYFEKRLERSSDCLTTARFIEAGVVRDIEAATSAGLFPGDIAEHAAAIIGEHRIRDDSGVLGFYADHGKSYLIIRLQVLFKTLGEHVSPATYLAEAGLAPANIGHIELPTGDMYVRLSPTLSFHSGWLDRDDPDTLPAGDWLSVVVDNKLLFHVESSELFCSRKRRCEYLREFASCCGDRKAFFTLPNRHTVIYHSGNLAVHRPNGSRELVTNFRDDVAHDRYELFRFMLGAADPVLLNEVHDWRPCPLRPLHAIAS